METFFRKECTNVQLHSTQLLGIGYQILIRQWQIIIITAMSTKFYSQELRFLYKSLKSLLSKT